MSYDFETIVVGGGCIGSSILFALSRQGSKDIALIDTGRNTVSATAQSGGMLRAFHEDPRHTALALSSYGLLNQYRNDHTLDINLCLNGSLYFFNRSRYPSFEASLRLLANAGFCFEVIAPEVGRNQFPQFQWDSHDLAIYEPTGSAVFPSQLTEQLLRNSVTSGASIFEGQEVHDIVRKGPGYQLRCNDQIITARRVVLAGGVRMLPLLKKLAIDLPLESRRLTTYTALRTTSDPTLPNYFDRETLEFAKLGVVDRVVLSDKRPLRLKESHWQESYQEAAAEDCYTPDRQGIITNVPHLPGIIVATGWGGTALKFALAVGMRVAQTQIPIQPGFERKDDHVIQPTA